MINRQYKIIRKLGEGRSQVFLCRDLCLDGQETAIKILPKDSPDEEKKFFRNEFLTLRKINHPNIIKSFDYGVAFEIENSEFKYLEGCKFFALEYCNGVELLDFPGIDDENNIVEIVKQICEVLFYLHQSGYIYYDLKPENILITAEENKISVKLIDLGFAVKGGNDKTIRGTAEYIAPEILKSENHNYTADLYSLGVLLYRLIYKKFPFNYTSQLEIYKAQIEQEFTFPNTDYSQGIVNIVRKLLMKDPAERYSSALQVITDLGYIIDRNITSYFLPVKVFAARQDMKAILQKYEKDKSSTEVFNVRGTEGSGKTSLFTELREIINKSILIENENHLTGSKFIRRFLNKILYADFIYNDLTDDERQKFYSLTSFSGSDILINIKSLFTSVCRRIKFTLLLDDFDSYDDFILDIVKELIPILQANNIKVIISENSEEKSSADFIFNKREIHLSSFMESELSEFLEISYNSFFPRQDLKKCILMYADLLPGNVEDFIRDLLLFNILQYSADGIRLDISEKSEQLLKSSNDVIYQVRVNQLSSEEKRAAEIISCFKISPDQRIIAALLGADNRRVKDLLESLGQKNIILNDTRSIAPVFTSSGLKDFFYSKIEDRSELHLFIADTLKDNSDDTAEIARQFELAGLYNDSYEYLIKEIESASRRSLFSYQKNLLQHLLTFPLDEEKLSALKIKLAGIYHSTGDHKSSLKLINELSGRPATEYETLMIKGGALIGTGEIASGVRILNELLVHTSEEQKPGLLLKIASAELDINNFTEAEDICSSILNNPAASAEEMGKTFNLLGIIKIETQNDFDSALNYFSRAENVYRKGDFIFGIAQMQNNIANIHNLRGNLDKAEFYWNESLKLNLEIGNLEQEANILMNFGIFYFGKKEYEKAVSSYRRAYDIYTSIGNRLRESLVQVNFGEVYLELSDYGEALAHLENAAVNFRQLKNTNEEAEVLSILSRLYLILGDGENFNKVITKFELLKELQNISEKNKIYIRYLKIISEIRFSGVFNFLRELRVLRNYFIEQKERQSAIESSFYIVKLLLEDKRYSEALMELNNRLLIEYCSNDSAEAERVYLLSRLAAESSGLKIEPEIIYLQQAYEIVQNSNIAEYTWKILFALARHYYKRGTLSKAEEMIIYCKTVLDYLSFSLKDESLRKKYLDEPERKAVIEQLKTLEAQF